jgi:glycosyltransferase involved in cell wall biosynthesis
MVFNRYKIQHLDLATGIHPINDDTVSAHYCVFWCKSVPLGHCFLTSDQIADTETFQKECLKAIAPALNYYSELYGWDKAVNTPSLLSLKSSLEKLADVLHLPAIAESCDVSVVICTRNRADSLKQCLQALALQVCKPAEVIVVDNASSSRDTKRTALAYRVRYILEEKIGLDIARNTGARAARHSIVAYTDDDTVPDQHWVYRINETFQDQRIAALTGLIVAGSLNNEAEIIFEKHWPFNRGYLPRVYDERFFKSTLSGGPPVWEIGAGANMAFRKSIFEDVGYFDERLDVGAAGCSGDSELWYRILAKGLVIQYNPLAMVRHFHRSSIAALKRQLYSYMKGFTVAILIQYQRFGHSGNLRHLFQVVPLYYLSLFRKGFPFYNSQYKTLLSEVRGVLAGMIYFLKHRNTNPGIYDNETL